jgi:hypothetical protein
VNVLEGSGVLLGVGVGVLVGIQAEVRISKAKTSIFFMGSFSFKSTIRIRLHATVRQTGEPGHFITISLTPYVLFPSRRG